MRAVLITLKSYEMKYERWEKLWFELCGCKFEVWYHTIGKHKGTKGTMQEQDIIELVEFYIQSWTSE